MQRHSRPIVHGAVFLVALYTAVTRPRLPLTDEVWFLQVLDRVQQGDVLYRDVFFGATPLSAYLALGPVSVFGSELIVLRLLAAICFTASVVLASGIVRKCGVASGLPMVAVGFLLVHGFPGNYGYSAVANLCLLACFYATLSWATGDTQRPKRPAASLVMLMVAGVWAGLCFAAKQNVGVYTLGALLLCIALRPTQASAHAPVRRGRAAALVVGSFSATVAALLTPVIASGAAPEFWAHTVANKGLYVQYGSSLYPDGLAELGRVVVGDWSMSNLKRANLLGSPALLVCVLLLLASSWARPGPRGNYREIVLPFVGAGILGVLPGLDRLHIAPASAIMVVGCIWAWSAADIRLGRSWRQALTIGVAAWVLLPLSVRIVEPPARFLNGQLRPSVLPHLSGVFVPVEQDSAVRASAERLQSYANRDEVLLLNRDASLYYLAGGLRNPTPFDYPLVNSFGHNGQEQVALAIDRAEIKVVCLPKLQTSLTPRLLDRHVRTHLKPGDDVGLCQIFTGP